MSAAVRSISNTRSNEELAFNYNFYTKNVYCVGGYFSFLFSSFSIICTHCANFKENEISLIPYIYNLSTNIITENVYVPINTNHFYPTFISVHVLQ